MTKKCLKYDFLPGSILAGVREGKGLGNHQNGGEDLGPSFKKRKPAFLFIPALPYIEQMTGVYTDNQPDFTWLRPYEEKTFTYYFMPNRYQNKIAVRLSEA